MSDKTGPCPRCTRPTGEHTVDEFTRCMADLHDHDLPFESMPETQQTLDVVTAGSVAVKAGVQDSPLGAFPVLVFEFTSPTGPVPPIALILDAEHMRSVRRLVTTAVDAALKAARARRS